MDTTVEFQKISIYLYIIHKDSNAYTWPDLDLTFYTSSSVSVSVPNPPKAVRALASVTFSAVP